MTVRPGSSKTVSLGMSFGCIGLFVTVGAAAAADLGARRLPDPSVANFAGWYAGIHAGYGFGETSSHVTTLPSPVAFNEAPTVLALSPSGALAGGQIGYNWQAGQVTLGLEADFSYSGIKGTGQISPLQTVIAPAPSIPGSYQLNSYRINWLGTVRVRAGILATPQILLFGTGGLAYGQVEVDAFQSLFPDPSLQFSASSRRVKAGWTIGAGGEWAFAQDWSTKLEYLYYDLGSETLTADRTLLPDQFKVVSDFQPGGHQVRLGVNYRFHH